MKKGMTKEELLDEARRHGRLIIENAIRKCNACGIEVYPAVKFDVDIKKYKQWKKGGM